ncbi:hypothetical protein F2Q68_00022465 [Brassica cretica]|uniref:Uncharacterized protein n=1 Tax=Brassica cretica TaxID=69181 RepID=A0A8S9FRJ9_BRACR|nr:hypothetical protein F2Q68_00022465 [Brassica cretica]
MIVLKRCELLPTAKAAFADGRVETSQVLKPEFKKILREILSYGGGGKDLAEIGESYGVLKAIDKAKRVINCPREVEPECDILSPSPKKVDAPKEFKCTLSKKIMIEPVIIASEQVLRTSGPWKLVKTRYLHVRGREEEEAMREDKSFVEGESCKCEEGKFYEAGELYDEVHASIIVFDDVGFLLDGGNPLGLVLTTKLGVGQCGLEIHQRDLYFNGWIFCCLGFGKAGRHSSSAGQSWVFGNLTVRSSLLELKFGRALCCSLAVVICVGDSSLKLVSLFCSGC